MLVDQKLVVLEREVHKFRDCAPNQRARRILAFEHEILRTSSILYKSKFCARWAQNDEVGFFIRFSVCRRSELRHFDIELTEALPDKYEIKEIEKPSKLQKKIRKNWLNEEEDKQPN